MAGGPSLDPRLQDLLARRRRLAAALSVIVSAIYALVALGCAFAPGLMQRPAAGTHITVGVFSMLAVIVIGIATAGYYTWWCNTVRDPLVAEVLRAGKAGAPRRIEGPES
jgi:uncharacterized membrane protein (DUF485 family)